MAHYLLKIKPVEHFFFGVEKVGNLGNRKPYYLETTEYPQQTSILGLLRYILLLREDKLGKDITLDQDVIELIGKQSFPGNDYGKIKSISPVFIIDNDDTAFFVRPLDWEYRYVKKDEGSQVCYGTNRNTSELIPFFEGYKAKDGIAPYLISSNGISMPLWYNKIERKGVLHKQAKAGNQKNPKRFIDAQSTDEEKTNAKNEAYYKQEFLYMENEFAYAAVVEIDIDKLQEFKTIVPFGGEQSCFSIYFKLLKDTKSVDDYYFKLQPQNDYLKIELLSDTYLEQSILNLACFAACDTIGFRNLKSSTTTKNYSRISKNKEDNSADISNSQLQLLKRGSVLFFNSVEMLHQAEEKLNNNTFTTIGYNKYRKFELKKIDDHGTI